MRLLFISIVFATISPTCAPQWWVDSVEMNFDTVGTLMLDSIYPSGCWQIGRPNKPIFADPLSEPNALVTDTLMPHPDSSIWYAQFSFNTDQSHLITFQHWIDTDSLDSFGWVEVFDWYDLLWKPIPVPGGIHDSVGNYYTAFYSDPNAAADEFKFSGSSSGWSFDSIWFTCQGKFRPPDDDRWKSFDYGPMLMRFVFQAPSNPNNKDGWMIDNVTVYSGGACVGAINELKPELVRMFPNPARDRLNVVCEWISASWIAVEIVDPSGRVTSANRWPSCGSYLIDLQGLNDGLYAVRLTSADKSYSQRIIVQS